MAFSDKYPSFTIRRDAFPEGEDGKKMYKELAQVIESITEFHKEVVELLYQRIKLTKYTNVAEANLAFTKTKGHLAYNSTDDEPMFYNGTDWKKVSDGTNAS